ncbi:MAG: type III-B CRISPR-associated protein Cas10/Cmr2 [Lentisphaerae bacterium]|nr:type III-B CRISPR-associated protein Cas10/Cmr2 [Lentisphaerota bacterium]
MPTDNSNFWKRKLLAFLHDPPHKPYGIANHEETTKSNLNLFGLAGEDAKDFEDKFSFDSFAAVADRFIFPNPRKDNLKTNWFAEGLPFIHPFCGEKLIPHERPVTRDVAEDWMSCALSQTISEQNPTKENFIKAWRLWERNLIKTNRKAAYYFPYLVADTRIPDHTIWQHNALTSAIAGCNGNPAFLLFQLGPVQNFIAQAKTTRDLWAGSYILSYLNAQAIHAVANNERYGPDHIIFPQIKNNPIIDKLFWGVYGDDLEFSDKDLNNWKRKQLLIPSLPNRFMALVDHDDKEIVDEIKDKVLGAWKEIEDAIHEYLKKKMDNDFPGWDELWKEQVHSFPRIDCLVHPFEGNDEIIREFVDSNSPPYVDPKKHPVIQNLHWAVDCICYDYLDPRNYKHRYDRINRCSVMLNAVEENLCDGEKPIINNPGFTWALQYLKAEWKFAALRNSRTFDQRFDFKDHGYSDSKRWLEKDPLDGVNEVLGGKRNKEFWQVISKDNELKKYFRGKQRYGAISVIKRLFAKVYLQQPDIYDLDSDYRIKSTYEIATGRKIDDDTSLSESDKKYYAVICLDGDNMGKLLSGENAMPLEQQLSGQNIINYFKQNWKSENAGKLMRAVTPSYHLMFSEALSNFSNYCVEPIVSEFKGQLIYAGGDDVLAMVPVDSALDCAEALQYAFRGLKPSDQTIRAFKVLDKVFDYEWCEMEKKKHVDGFLKLKKSDTVKPSYPMLMPGPKTTVSAGIAVGHVKSPMQDIIQAARDAEKNAKDSGKDGFCLTIKKRSGEENSFFAHWNRKSEDKRWLTKKAEEYPQLLSLWNQFSNDPQLQDSSNRLPYLYSRYISGIMKTFKGCYHERFDDDMKAACREFMRIVLERQTKLGEQKAEARADNVMRDLNLDATTPENYVNFWMCLAFMNRKGGDE